MMDPQATDNALPEEASPPPERGWQLVVVWCGADPGRCGEAYLVGGDHAATLELGRGQGALYRCRPGRLERRPPLEQRHLSRRQLQVTAHGERGLRLVNLGQRTLRVDGREVTDARVQAGAVVELDRCLLLWVQRAPAFLHADPAPADHAFGQPDADGIVGESEAVWALRAELDAAARAGEPVLVLGESGTGKELVALGIARRCGRQPVVSRNMATLSPGVAAAELFGSVRDFPNAGMPERPGMVGAAGAGVLFLDELGEVEPALQAALLRLVEGGAYTRLGEAAERRTEALLVAATNRDPSELRLDLVARFRRRITVPPLRQRSADLPLLAAALRPDAALQLRSMAQLLRSALPANVRELQRLLSTAVVRDGQLVLAEATVPAEPEAAGRSWRSPKDVSRMELLVALEEESSLEAVWKRLGLRDRYALRRLMDREELDNPYR
ncbi:MAG: sigma 54-interacting transcriptional regulator [Myxococcales bacterium]|nr:sigma 54-interacting transcriptional regulator [Myxococcales bacterium]